MAYNQEGCWAPPNSLNLSDRTDQLGASSVSSADIEMHRSQYIEMMPEPEPQPLTIQP